MRSSRTFRRLVTFGGVLANGDGTSNPARVPATALAAGLVTKDDFGTHDATLADRWDDISGYGCMRDCVCGEEWRRDHVKYKAT